MLDRLTGKTGGGTATGPGTCRGVDGSGVVPDVVGAASIEVSTIWSICGSIDKTDRVRKRSAKIFYEELVGTESCRSIWFGGNCCTPCSESDEDSDGSLNK